MFHSGSLLYINDFDFLTINPTLRNFERRFRDKYVLVLDEVVGESIFCCFVSRLENYPLLPQVAIPGCNAPQSVPVPHRIYHFAPTATNICTRGQFTFPTLTFISGVTSQIFHYDLPDLYENYDVSEHVNSVATISDKLRSNIIYCLFHSDHISEDIKDKLSEILAPLMIEIQREEDALD